MTKKQLYVIIGIFAIITVGFLLATFIITQSGNTKDAPKKTISSFFPFGQDNEAAKTPDEENAGGGTETGNGTPTRIISKKDLPLLRLVSPGPVAGLYAADKLGKTYVSFLEKESGNVFETKLEDMQSNRISNSLIPKITEALFANKGNSVVLRYLKNKSDTIYSFVLDTSKAPVVPEENATSTNNALPNGKFLSVNIKDIKISNDGRTAFYLTESDSFNDKTSFGSVYDFEKNSVSDVFQSPFSEWLPLSYNSKMVLLQTKSSKNVPGFLYSFSVKTGVLQKILGNITGLTTLPNAEGDKILYSESTKGGVMLRIYSTGNDSIVDLSLQTLPEKCVWKGNSASLYCAIPDIFTSGDYPDMWYQGIFSFTDTLWEVDAKTGKMSAVLDPTLYTEQEMDMTNLTLSPSEDFLFFLNKKNSSLWAYDLKDTRE